MNDSSTFSRRLNEADRIHQRELGGRFLLRASFWLPTVLVTLFVLDVLLHLGNEWRLVLSLTLVTVALILLGRSWYISWVRRNQLQHIARFLEERDPALGSQLINALQLQSQSADTTLTPLTRSLAAEAVERYGAQLQPVDLARLARTPALQKDFRRTAWMFLAAALLMAVVHPVTKVEILRFADPLGDHPPYSFTRLEIAEPGASGASVVFGRNFVVRVNYGGHRPKEVFLTAHPVGHPEQAITLPMLDKGILGFHQQVENVRTDLVVFAHTQDRHSMSRKRSLGVIRVPQLEKAFVQTAPPAYTGIKPEEHPYQFKGLQVLKGTELRFRLQSNRPLKDGQVEFRSGDRPPVVSQLVRSAENEVTGSILAMESGRMQFRITDVDGRVSTETREGGLTVMEDLPPEIRFVEPAGDSFVAMDFKVKVALEATDDYGLRTIRIHRGLNRVFSPPKVITFDTVVRTVGETFELSIGRLGVEPGDVISFFAEATDTSPATNMVRTPMVNLTVISVEDYNLFLRQQTDMNDTAEKYAELIGQLHDQIEAQRKLAESADKLAGRLAKAEGREREALQAEFDGLIARQNEINQKFNQQAQRMEEFVRKDPVYDVEEELQSILTAKAGEIRSSTQLNDRQAKGIAERSSPPSGPRQVKPEMAKELAEAAREQANRLAGVEESTAEAIMEPLEDLAKLQELMKDFNAFEQLYNEQKALADQAAAYNRSGPLSPEDQQALKSMAAAQRQVAEDLAALERKLREDAAAAAEKFPKAAKSGSTLAGRISELRLESLARNATSMMIKGAGDGSFQSADRVRSEMEKLFTECKANGRQPESSELDQYLKLSRGMNPGNNFKQMALCQKMGGKGSTGQNGRGPSGSGRSGKTGYAMTDGQSVSVLGNESRVQRGQASANSSRNGNGTGKPDGAGEGPAVDKAEAIQGVQPVNRKSGAVTTGTMIEEYNEVVDNYFKSITKGGKK